MEDQTVTTQGKKRRVCAICGKRRLCTTAVIGRESKFVCAEEDAVVESMKAMEPACLATYDHHITDSEHPIHRCFKEGDHDVHECACGVEWKPVDGVPFPA